MNYRELVVRLVRLLGRLRIPYMVVGGLAVNVYGMLRATFDVDIVVMLESHQVRSLVVNLQRIGFDIEEADVQTMLRVGNRFMTNHPTIPHRVDFWISSTEYDGEAFKRRRQIKIFGRMAWMIAPEDLILSKLTAGRGKDQDDTVGVLKRQAGRMDEGYLTRWAKRLNVMEKLDRLRKV